MNDPPVVFISYAHDSGEHKELVRRLWEFLRSRGIDAKLDLSAAAERRDWALWMGQQIDRADYVLVIASPAYRERGDGDVDPHDGRGVQYEAALLKDRLMQDRAQWTGRMLPVILPGRSAAEIPRFLQPYAASRYEVTDFTDVGAEELLRVVTKQAKYPEPPLGTLPRLPPETGRSTEGWRIGNVPTLASALQPREGLRERVDAARTAGGGVLLTQVLAGGGGVGKSQLAAAYAHQAIHDGVDLVVWINAAGPEAVMAAYAQTAAQVRTPGVTGSDAHADARALLAWLAGTDRRWLIVLDDITDPDQMKDLWPVSHTATGWVLATTRRRDASLSGGGRALVSVDVYGPAESINYLTQRLTAADAASLLDDRVGPLADAMGHLPLALGHAAAYMINEGVDCTGYLTLLIGQRSRLEQLMPQTADTENYGRPIAAALLIALDAAQAAHPVGLAKPALRLAAVLDPAGHPDTLWTAPAVGAYLNQFAPTADARAALRLLHRYGLVHHEARGGPRAVRIHALTARAARETNSPAELHAAIRTAADALLSGWPEPDTHPDHGDLVAALRANTTSLAGHPGDQLWRSPTHELLYRAGESLLDAGLHAAAVAYNEGLVDAGERIFGSDHEVTISARAYLAISYSLAGRTNEAMAIKELVLSDRERILGPDDPKTITARANLAISYRDAGRTTDAIALQERALADSERVRGAKHPSTLIYRSQLAATYRQVGRTDEAIVIHEQVVADTERVRGPEHIDTLTARSQLAASYRQAGRTTDAIPIEERVAADAERVLGAEHPDTIVVLANLAASYRQAGRIAEATSIQERVLAGRDRILGPEHPRTVTARITLAVSYHQAGRIAEALALQERVVAEHERILGPEHPDTVRAAEALRAWKQQSQAS
ncbi:tetratricopeptide repeat protein [Phytohabitans rumicis]|uniref:Tetratricopeptide repeat protein n=1 Tax=Phytohabitans rumicis TaxID=1076125 RepID=A0A6V8LHC7_9ACTN|nr:toll/interleukin-1 receptor domain-containing protein [Phytohabitans rumicis]GFJ94271.1 tetratricopeptide repeat protein [Phytohabitans rumicis]